MPDTRSQRNDASGKYARFVGLGVTFMFIIASSTVVGYFLDRLAGTLPLFLLIGLASGLGGMFYVYGRSQSWALMGDHWRLAFRCGGYGFDVPMGRCFSDTTTASPMPKRSLRSRDRTCEPALYGAYGLFVVGTEHGGWYDGRGLLLRGSVPSRGSSAWRSRLSRALARACRCWEASQGSIWPRTSCSCPGVEDQPREHKA